MSYAIIESYNNSQATVRIGGLEHPAVKYDCFRLYFGSTHMGKQDPTSWSSSHEAYVNFDLTKTADGRTTANGSYSATIYAVLNGTEYNVPISNNSWIKIDKSGGGSIFEPDDPPSPPPSRNHEMSYIHINKFNEDEDGYLEVQVTTDGYGEVDLVSVTKAYNLYRSDGTKTDKHVKLASSRIYESDLRNGMYEGTLIFRFNKTDLSSFPSVPAGTCHLASGSRGWLQSDYDVYSKEFMCLSEYRHWQQYKGVYYAELTNASNGYNVSATRLSTVSEDWRRVVNMAFYLEATAYGNIKYSTYRAYIPSGGEILTANMYNSLINAVRKSCERVGVNTYGLPSYVSSGDIISKYFLYTIGRTIDEGLIKQKTNANRRAIW